MINEVIIKNTPQFKSELKLDNLRKVNFIFGNNGTGKTSISKILEKVDDYSDCSIKWRKNKPIQIMVYNRDYVNKNFFQKDNLDGIFTLGNENVEVENQIPSLKKDLHINKEKIDNYIKEQKQNKADIDKLEEQFLTQCWNTKTKNSEDFAVIFSGYNSNRKKFKDKIIAVSESNQVSFLSLQMLKKQILIVFNENLREETLLSTLSSSDIEELINIGIDPILSEIIVGNQNIDYASLIESLQNSDWVKQGIDYHNQKPDVCPFCQQNTDQSISENLKKIFDKNYERKMQYINELHNQYKTSSQQILQVIDGIESVHIDSDLFVAKIQLFKSQMSENLSLLKNKISKPSQEITLNSVQELCNQIQELITQANDRIKEQNTIIDNKVKEKEILIAQIWQYLVNELGDEIKNYNINKENLDIEEKRIKNLLDGAERHQLVLEMNLSILEKTLNTCVPIKDEINSLLEKFGFFSFRIEIIEVKEVIEDTEKAVEKKYYKICRENGEVATYSLSEGEKTFITFLYFYFQVINSQDDLVVVFDDPISSLDSNIMHIITTLIKNIMYRTLPSDSDEMSFIKQVFILTHNVYFYKEITYRAKKENTFWMLRKNQQNTSTIEFCKTNPIQSSYELLWREVQTKDNISIANIVRRIVENYFKFWGGMDIKNIPSLFEGIDKINCQSLLSWANDGSHSIMDDFNNPPNECDKDIYLKILKDIFEKSGNLSHYEMMINQNKIE